MIDDIKYWKKRHESLKGDTAAVGQKSFSEKANFYIYKILKEQYEKVLKKINLKHGSKALDAGAGTGIFSEFLFEHGFEVTACDISPVALSLIKNEKIKKICSTIGDINLQAHSFDVVYSFDVLYHILDDKIWEESLGKMCLLSDRYVILHERFLKHKQIITSKHVKLRTYKKTIMALNKYGFFEVLSVPTHFFAIRLPTYRISKYFPKFFYSLDRFTLDFLNKVSLKNFGSHHIKVFERKKS